MERTWSHSPLPPSRPPGAVRVCADGGGRRGERHPQGPPAVSRRPRLGEPAPTTVAGNGGVTYLCVLSVPASGYRVRSCSTNHSKGKFVGSSNHRDNHFICFHFLERKTLFLKAHIHILNCKQRPTDAAGVCAPSPRRGLASGL